MEEASWRWLVLPLGVGIVRVVVDGEGRLLYLAFSGVLVSVALHYCLCTVYCSLIIHLLFFYVCPRMM